MWIFVFVLLWCFVFYHTNFIVNSAMWLSDLGMLNILYEEKVSFIQKRTYYLLLLSYGRVKGGWLYLYSFICWSSRVGVFLLCYHSIAPCTSKGDISASAICHLWRFVLIHWYIGRPWRTLSCYFGDLSYSSHFTLRRHVHIPWLWGSGLWVWAYSPIVFTFISVDVNVLVAVDDHLYLNSCR